MKLIRFLLFPFAILYNLITNIRNRFFDANILQATSFPIPVIAVGNLNVGGTGKTPQIEYLIRLLKDSYKVGVLSRGYKRKTKGYLLLNETHSAKDVGDEPLQFYKKFNNIKVAVDADRTHGIQQLLEGGNPPDIVLLDDAFQHRKVKAGYYILLTKYNDLYCDDFLLPTGNLRESRSGAKRADLIIVTKCPEDLSESNQNRIIKKLNIASHQKVFFSKIIYNEVLKGREGVTIDNLRGKQVVLVTGIANPKPLVQYLKGKSISFEHLKYPDHHEFSEDDIAKIRTAFSNDNKKSSVVLTTEKDYVRLQKEVEGLCYIEIRNSFFNEQDTFDFEIQRFINK